MCVFRVSYCDMRRTLAGAVVLSISSAASSTALAAAGKPKLDFNRDVRPILSDKCFQCHGPDPKTRKAKLRLDEQKGALADLGGYKAILPGQPDKSEVYLRVTAKDPDDRPTSARTPTSAWSIACFPVRDTASIRPVSGWTPSATGIRAGEDPRRARRVHPEDAGLRGAKGAPPGRGRILSLEPLSSCVYKPIPLRCGCLDVSPPRTSYWQTCLRCLAGS